ncbi:tetratricopeptide repeat protein [Methanogenium cariaci]|uniref:tetratricopeptide repeat protein n=1 Tax=Methanogenium cariaci TaxID=2197 RepID=UPI001FE14362|nr:tetratricopeptide repeat protein [Methanogenium cariaci]
MRLDPDDATAWYGKGNALAELGRSEEALTAYTRVTEIEPDDVDAWYARGLVLHQLGRYKDAVAAYDRVLSLDPENTCARDNRETAQNKQQPYEVG